MSAPEEISGVAKKSTDKQPLNDGANPSYQAASTPAKPAKEAEATSTCGCFKPQPAGHNVTSGIACSVCFNPLIWFLWFFDFLVWFIYFIIIGWLLALIRCCGRKAVGRQLKDGAWRTNIETDELTTSPDGTAMTAWDCFEHAFKTYSDKKCLGTRTYLGEWRKEPGHKIVKKVFGETSWATYGDIHKRAEAIGRGLVKLGMVPSSSKTKAEFEESQEPDTLLLWEDTCADWMCTLAGAFSQSLVVATSYSTLGMDGVVESIGQCTCPVVVCNRNQVAKLVEAYKTHDEIKSLHTIIYTDLNCGGGKATGQGADLKLDAMSLTPTPLPALEIDCPEGLKIMGFEEVVKLGSSGEEVDTKRPSAQTMAVVMYTSGSTGKPKGVVIRHSNICASVSGMSNGFSEWGVPGGEAYLAYLPAAHILELCAEVSMLSFGAEIGYADPRSIASSGACRMYMKDGKLDINHEPSLTIAPGAIQEFKPTVIAAVPKIWDILKKGIEEKIGKSSAAVRVIFEAAYAACKNAESWRCCPLLSLVFKKSVGAIVGGRLKVGISGGGPISGDVQDFCRTAFQVPIVQGYALTETCCAGTFQSSSDSRNGVVGAPLSSVEIKLESCAEINDRTGAPYLESDTKHWDGSECTGRGEVLIRGPSVSLGYYARGEQREDLIKKTTEEFSSVAPNEDGKYDWFRTGDIGLFTPDGGLKLVDRKKNLVKLHGGEYIAVEQMEAVYGTSLFVDAKNGGMMVHGDGEMDRPVALVQANIPHLRKWAEENGVSASTPEELCNNPQVLAAGLADFGKIAQGRLARNEVLCKIAFIPGTGPADFPGNPTSPWTPENGYLTASNKLDRNAVKHGKSKEEAGQVLFSESFDVILQPLRAAAGAQSANHV